MFVHVRQRWVSMGLSLLSMFMALALLVILFQVPLISGWRENLPVWAYPLLGAVMGRFMLSPIDKFWRLLLGAPPLRADTPATRSYQRLLEPISRFLARALLEVLALLSVALLLGIWAAVHWGFWPTLSSVQVAAKLVIIVAVLMAVFQILLIALPSRWLGTEH